MYVKLLTHTPDPERLVAAAAGVCYSSDPIDNIYNNMTQERIEKLIQSTQESGHNSITEHVTFTFAIAGISRACLAQLTRHRIASYSVRSQRYITEGGAYCVTPNSICQVDGVRELYNMAIDFANHSYKTIQHQLETKYLSDGFSKTDARTKANEDARFVLPNATETQLIVTMNARSLYNFFALRTCNRAQWEIRELANEMLAACKEVAPVLFAKAGKPCLFGECPEGSRSCKNKKN